MDAVTRPHPVSHVVASSAMSAPTHDDANLTYPAALIVKAAPRFSSRAAKTADAVVSSLEAAGFVVNASNPVDLPVAMPGLQDESYPRAIAEILAIAQQSCVFVVAETPIHGEGGPSVDRNVVELLRTGISVSEVAPSTRADSKRACPATAAFGIDFTSLGATPLTSIVVTPELSDGYVAELVTYAVIEACTSS
jgi:hypothetical protein